MYVIINDEGLWWSNADGWCDNTRSLFTQEETDVTYIKATSEFTYKYYEIITL